MTNTKSAFTLEGAPNFRDIGGYKTADGISVRHHRVFRSERLTSLTPSDLDIIRKVNIRTVCDLRSVKERALHPNRWPENHAFDELHCNILTDVRAANASVFEPLRKEPTAAGARNMMKAIYRAMPDAFTPYMGQLVNRIADGQLPMLIHCTAGKDRTGFAVAALLSVLDVPRDAIYHDYLLTEKFSNHDERIAYVTEMAASQLGRAPDDAIVRTIMGVDPAYLDAAFEALESSYGSVKEYFRRGCSIEEARLLQMKNALLE